MTNKKVKKFVVPETVKCFGGTFEGELMTAVAPDKLGSVWVPVRIVRESDWKRVIALARKAKDTKP